MKDYLFCLRKDANGRENIYFFFFISRSFAFIRGQICFGYITGNLGYFTNPVFNNHYKITRRAAVGKPEPALKIFRKTIRRHPDFWFCVIIKCNCPKRLL